MDALVLEDVSKSFGAADTDRPGSASGGVRAVDSLSVRIPAGCIYGFLGPNGAGKTTTLRMIMDIIVPDSGRILVLDGPAGANAREKIGYLPEERGLYRKMKVRSLLRFMGGIKGLAKKLAARRAAEWLETVGLSDSADNRVEELSKGNQQKLQFAVTAMGDPEILILDEPFSGLDPINLEMIKGIILRMRDAGKTVLFSTHMMDHAERLCDSILLINTGRTVLEGNLEEIQGRYRSNTVSVEIEGDAGFINQLPMVARATASGKEIEITLEERADDQDLLKELVQRCRVRRFERKAPSLHEIFVRLAGPNDA